MYVECKMRCVNQEKYQKCYTGVELASEMDESSESRWIGMGAEIFLRAWAESVSKASIKSCLIFRPNARPKEPYIK